MYMPYLMSIFYQSLFNFFPLWWNVMKIFLIKWLFIIPTRLKLSNYSLFSYNPDFRNLTRGGLVGARRLHTMDRNKSNLTPVCSSIRALKHTSEHSAEQLWHWLCDNHRFCIQTLADKKLIAVMKGTPKRTRDCCHDPNRTCGPTTRALLHLSDLSLPSLTSFCLSDQWKTEMIFHCCSCNSEWSLSHVQIQFSSWV